MVQKDEVVKNVFNTIPLAFKCKQEKAGQLSQQQIEQFFDKGWVVVPNLIEVCFALLLFFIYYIIIISFVLYILMLVNASKLFV